MEDAKSLRVQQLETENDQLKMIVNEMKKEMDQIRERTLNSNTQAQTIFELRRELYKVQAEKKNMELEKEFLEHNQVIKKDTDLLNQLNDKEAEVYDLKMKMITKENDIITLNQK